MKNLFNFKWLLLCIVLSIASVSQILAATLVKGERLYADVHDCGYWYTNSSTDFRLWYGEGVSDYVDVEGSVEAGFLWSCEVERDDISEVQLLRVNPSDHNTIWDRSSKFEIEDGKDVLKLTEYSQTWASCTWYATTPIYVTPSTLTYTNSATWNPETNTLKANVKVGDNPDRWMTRDMTFTGRTYEGAEIYSCKLYCLYGGVHVVQFQVYTGETQDGLKEFDKSSKSWSFNDCWTNIQNKIYDGSSWLTYGKDITIYAIPNAETYGLSPAFDESIHKLLANVKIGSTGSGEWLGTWPVFSKTDYKFNGNWIYKATVFAKYNVIFEIQFQAKKKSDDTFVSQYDFNPGYACNADDLDGKIFGGRVDDDHKWYNYATDISLDQQSGSGGTSSVTADVGSAMPAATMPTRAGYNFGGYFTEENGAGTQYYESDGSSSRTWIKDGPQTLYAKWTPVGMLTFNPASGTDWGTPGNWTPNCVPTIEHNVTINKPVIVGSTNAVAKSVKIYNDGSNSHTGKLTINAGQKLIVAQTISKTTDGSNSLPTTESILVIGSDGTNGNGALIWGENGTSPGEARVDFYSLSGKTTYEAKTVYVNQMIGTPFTSATSNWLYNYYDSWVLEVVYPGGDDAPYLAPISGDMDPFVGYSIIYNGSTGITYAMSGTLVDNSNVVCSELRNYDKNGTSEARNENLLANSWLAPIRIGDLISSCTGDVYPAVYIFSSTDGVSHPSGNYATYTSTSSSAVIPSMQCFSVYTTGGSGSLTLNYKDLVYDPAVEGTNPSPNLAPRRVATEEANKLRIFVKTKYGYGDMVYMWERSDFEEGYDRAWDGHKVYGDVEAPQLYAVTIDGNMAVNCIPDYEGTVLGFKAGTADTQYTMSFEYDEAEPLYLYDTQTKQETRIKDENTYTFITTDEVAHNRFVLSKTPKMPTGVEDTTNEGVKSVKFIENGDLYILRDGKLYNAMGTLVK